MIHINLIRSGSIPDVCSSYCLNGGICYKSNENPKCFCLPQWTGERCNLLQNSTTTEQMPVIEGDMTDPRSAQCNKLNPPFCQNGGICYVDTGDKFACHCQAAYFGENCEEESGMSFRFFNLIFVSIVYVYLECNGYCINGDCKLKGKPQITL